MKLLLILSLFLVIIACAKPLPAPIIEPAIEENLTIDPAPIPEAIVEKNAKEQETEAFLKKTTTLTNYAYNDDKYRVQVYDDLRLLESPILVTYKDRQYTLIYLNYTSKNAFIACTKKCNKADDKETYSQVDFTEFSKIIYPLQRMSFRYTTLDKSKTQIVEGIQSYKLTFNDTYGRQGHMWLDNYRAFPLEIEYADGEKVTYSQVSYGKGTLEQVSLSPKLKEKMLI